MLGTKPSTTMPTSMGSHATHSRTVTSWRCGSSANSSDGRAEGRALVEPEQVAGGQHGADGGDDHVEPEQPDVGHVGFVGREDGGELAPEPGQARQAERGHGAQAEDPAEVRHRLQHAAEPLDLERVVALLHRAGHEEEHAGDEAVGDHAEDGGVDAEGGEAGDAEHHVAHVRHRREGDEPLHVGLGQAAQGAVDDADDRQCSDVGSPRAGRVRAGSAGRCGRSRRCRASAARRPG